jgi:hypothetical protein
VLDLILAFLAAIRAFFRGRVQAFPAARCAETQTAATGVDQPGSNVLDKPAAGLAAMV